jgi:hypothetical protein
MGSSDIGELVQMQLRRFEIQSIKGFVTKLAYDEEAGAEVFVIIAREVAKAKGQQGLHDFFESFFGFLRDDAKQQVALFFCGQAILRQKD